GLSAAGLIQSVGFALVVTMTGTSTAIGVCPPRPAPRAGSGPRSPASTSGPHMMATRRESFASGSRGSVLGITSSIGSPDFHARFSSTYAPGPGTDEEPATGDPLTLTMNPSPAHCGRRSATVNVFGAASVSVIFAVSPSGKVVSIASLTFSADHSAVDGA